MRSAWKAVDLERKQPSMYVAFITHFTDADRMASLFVHNIPARLIVTSILNE